MKQMTNEQLALVAGGCSVDYRVAYGITDPHVMTPAVMIPVDCITGKPIPIPIPFPSPIPNFHFKLPPVDLGAIFGSL